MMLHISFRSRAQELEDEQYEIDQKIRRLIQKPGKYQC